MSNTVATYEECQHCGSTRRMMGELLEKEIAGSITPDAIAHCRQEIFVNMDPMCPPIAGGRIKAARVFKDICLGCGRERIVRIDYGLAQLGLRPGEPAKFI